MFSDTLMKSELRLFLSIDIAGSTRLKNVLNHTTLLNTYNDRLRFMRGACNELGCAPDCEKLSKEAIEDEIIRQCASEDTDWAGHIEELFRNFNDTFESELHRQSTECCADFRTEPWKALGDELVYAQSVSNLIEVHAYVVAFLTALRKLDKGFATENKPLRLKGSAWTAGFPIRNRVIEFPFMKKMSAPTSPYPSRDYLGPEMDTGFRLGKAVWPGFLVVSFELAQLLGKVETRDQIKLCLIGWEELKGVWNDLKYPIIWGTLNNDVYAYREYRTYDLRTNKYLDWWITQTKRSDHPKEAKELRRELMDIINDLNAIYPEFGIVEPYFPSDPEENRPSVHRELKRLLEKVRRSKSGVDGIQDRPSVPSGLGPTPADSLRQLKQKIPVLRSLRNKKRIEAKKNE